MAEITIPLATSLNIEHFEGTSISVASSIATNVVFEEYPEGEIYATQRPSFNTTQDASAVPVTNSVGRGVYYWEDGNNAAGTTFLANNTKLYSPNYGTEISITDVAGTGTFTFTSGLERMYFVEVGGYLFLLNPEDNEAVIIDTANNAEEIEVGATGNFTNITSTPAFDFTYWPTTWQHGYAVLNQNLYLLKENGQIWSHASGDPLDWSLATNFLTAEANEDKGLFIDRHLTDIVVFGSKTIEFFYDAGNAAGSSLSARTDIQHNIGLAEPKSVWTENDKTYFVGASQSGELGVYLLDRYQVKKVSNPTIDSYLGANLLIDTVKAFGSGFSSGGRTYYLLTLYTGTAEVNSSVTLVYNVRTGTWSRWEHASADIDNLPLVAWTTDTNLVSGIGILANGDFVEVYDDFSPQDSVGASFYWEDFANGASAYTTDDYGYVSATQPSGDNIAISIQIPHRNDDTGYRKFMDKLRVICDTTETSQTLSISWSDGNHANFNIPKTLDLSKEYAKITRLGNYRERTFKLDYSGDEQLRIRGLRAVVRQGAN